MYVSIYLAPPKYIFSDECKSMLEAPEGSTQQIHFTVSSNPPVATNTKHEIFCLRDGREVPATRRFTASQDVITLSNLKRNDSGIYQIQCENENGQVGKEIFEVIISCKYKLTV